MDKFNFRTSRFGINLKIDNAYAFVISYEDKRCMSGSYIVKFYHKMKSTRQYFIIAIINFTIELFVLINHHDSFCTAHCSLRNTKSANNISGFSIELYEILGRDWLNATIKRIIIKLRALSPVACNKTFSNVTYKIIDKLICTSLVPHHEHVSGWHPL